jgi:hypothetical protein
LPGDLLWERNVARRYPLLISGVVGLVCNVLFFSLVAWTRERFVPVIFDGWLVLLPLSLCLGFSVAEIPIMVFGLKRMASGRSPASLVLIALTNACYVFFAAVYAGIFVLLSGAIIVGAGLSALGLVRFVSSLLFVRPSLETE